MLLRFSYSVCPTRVFSLAEGGNTPHHHPSSSGSCCCSCCCSCCSSAPAAAAAAAALAPPAPPVRRWCRRSALTAPGWATAQPEHHIRRTYPGGVKPPQLPLESALVEISTRKGDRVAADWRECRRTCSVWSVPAQTTDCTHALKVLGR